MKFEPLFFKVIAIFWYSGVYIRLKYLHAVVTFYTYLLGTFFWWNGDHGFEMRTLCTYNIYISVIVIIIDDYLCYNSYL